MIVEINKKWRINIGSYNHTLERFEEGGNVLTSGKNKGQLSGASWITEGYFPNVQQCLRRAVFLEANVLSDTDLHSYIERLDLLTGNIKV